MIFIPSAAYVNSEFQLEFGKFPPAFLPIANKRLYKYQLEVIKTHFPNEKILISLPDDFSISRR